MAAQRLMMVNCGITQSSHVSWHHRATFQKSNEGKLNPKWWQVLCFGQVIEMCKYCTTLCIIWQICNTL